MAKRSERELDRIVRWLTEGARDAGTPEEVVARLCEDLLSLGVPLDRVAVFARTLHPNVMGRRFVWKPGEAVVAKEFDFAILDSEEYQKSPVHFAASHNETVRRRLADPAAADDFWILPELRDEGFTDYVATPLPFVFGEVHSASWATMRPGGFRRSDLRAIEAIREPLARVAEIYSLRRTARNLLDTYVGRRTGERVLAGRIRLGEVEKIRAAIWIADLRDFTRLAHELDGTELVALLNEFFGALVPAIETASGEVLKFIGDAVLAIFPVSDFDGQDERTVCREALGAAHHAAEALGELGVRYAVALHVGDVLYGNVGGASRLDFTAIGPAVNLAARLQALAATLGRSIIASEGFVRAAGGEFQCLGQFELKGFRELQNAFEPTAA